MYPHLLLIIICVSDCGVTARSPNYISGLVGAIRCAFVLYNMPTNPNSESAANIQLFSNPAFGSVRTAGTPANPLFCLADVCKSLDLGNPSQVKSRLDNGVISNEVIFDSLGRAQVASFVNEDGLYDVILDSRKPEAKAFRKWITSEVLPAIRQTGGYIQTAADDTDADIMAKALLIAQRTIDTKQQRIQMLEGQKTLLEKENALLQPKAQYTDDVLQSNETYTFTQLAKELNFRNVNIFITKLREGHVIFKQSGQWMLTAKYSGNGYTKARTAQFFHSDGSIGTSTSTVWTEKGRMFLHDWCGKLAKA